LSSGFQAVMNWFAGKGEEPNGFTALVHYGPHAHFEAANPNMMLCGTVCGLAGIVVAWLIYEKRSLTINSTIASTMSGIYKFSLNKWYIDQAYYWLVDKAIALYKAAWNTLDMGIVDNIVNGSALVTDTAGQLLKYSETGRAQTYALVIFSFVSILTLAVYFTRP
jgi:NADH:ubiquinone oxidoreductase subunit 5 (subunit L)/multisubunit Na+/H+ antiporter MnhA subunit